MPDELITQTELLVKRLEPHFRTNVNLRQHLKIAPQNLYYKISQNDLAKKYDVSVTRINQIVKFYRTRIEPLVAKMEVTQ